MVNNYTFHGNKALIPLVLQAVFARRHRGCKNDAANLAKGHKVQKDTLLNYNNADKHALLFFFYYFFTVNNGRTNT